jgi:hypothetical protein
LAFIGFFNSCSKKPGSVIEKFYQSKDWEEKKSLLADSDGIDENRVNDYLLRNRDTKIDSIIEKKRVSALITVYSVYWSDNKGHGIYEFIIKKVDGKEKIDLKTMIGYNKMSLSDFFYQKPKQAQFKVFCKLNSRNFNFDESYYEVGIYEGNIYLICGVKKNTEVGNNIINLIKDKKRHKLILVVEPLMTEWRTLVGVITKVVQEGWITEK